MKKAPHMLLAILLFLSITNAFADEFVTATIKDVGFTSKFEYAVDIYIVSDEMGSPFYLGETRLTVMYNSNVLSNPKLSDQNADFHSNDHYNAMQLNSMASGAIQLEISPKDEDGETLSSTEIRLGRITFSILNSTYQTETADIRWDQALLYTSVQKIDGTTVTFLSLEPSIADDIAGNTSLVCAPTISATPDTTALVGQWYSFTPTAVDVCAAGDLTFAISNPPDWAEFDTATGELSGTPAFSDVGTYTDIEITVADSYGDGTPLSAFDLEVTCPPGPAISDAVVPVTSIAVGDTYSFTPTVDDGCGALTFTISNQPAWADFDTATGALTGQPTFSNVGTDSGIVIRVTDENGDWDEVSFDIEVTADCTAPTLSGAPLASITSGDAYSFTPTVSNGCGAITFAITNQPSWADFDAGTGALTGTPDSSDVGLYSNIVITVTDEFSGSGSLTAFDIEVTCPPAPAISDAVAPATSIAVGATYSFTPTVDDGCGALTFTIFNQPAWADFDTATGALTGQPTFSNVGTTSGIVIRVTDENGDWDEMSFDIEVTADCTAPTLSGAPLASITSGDAYSFTPTVSNGCGAITFAITNQPSWADFDAGTGALTGTPDSSDVGLYSNIVITVTDEFSGSGSLTAFDIEVTDAGSSGDDDDGSSASGSGGGGGGGGCFIATMR